MVLLPLYDKDPLERNILPFVTYGLIAANILVFLFELGLAPQDDNAFVRTFALIPAALRGELTTGTLKAVGCLGLALLAASYLGLSNPRWLLAVGVLVLCTNVFNLLDLRPGRSTKAFRRMPPIAARPPRASSMKTSIASCLSSKAARSGACASTRTRPRSRRFSPRGLRAARREPARLTVRAMPPRRRLCSARRRSLAPILSSRIGCVLKRSITSRLRRT